LSSFCILDCAAAFLLCSSLNAPPPSALYTLSLHDALPISGGGALRRPLSHPRAAWHGAERAAMVDGGAAADAAQQPRPRGGRERSEEHTSELQSRVDLVCRLLLEKKKKTQKK